jgi:hypothetical protein
VAVYVGSALLLVRSSYRRGWHLPGGGVRRGETPETAAQRIAVMAFADVPEQQSAQAPTSRSLKDFSLIGNRLHRYSLTGSM